ATETGWRKCRGKRNSLGKTKRSLAKQREAWQERTPEVKGKQKGYKRVYDLDKMQNESEAEGTNRLQKRKQDQATETVDERARILEKL
ncbi:Hypothetical predicted protein, partial [Paramuricea clavata]